MASSAPPQTLSESDFKMFARLGIEPLLLTEARVCRVTDAEARGLYGMRFNGDLAGVVFPYLDPVTGNRATARLRRDHPDVDAAGNRENKYLCPTGDNRHLYFPPGASTLLADATVSVIVVEAEKSAIAITALAGRHGRKLLAIGVGGCWGWRGKTGIEGGPNGDREETRGPLPDFGFVTWRGRRCLIAFDANVASNPKVRWARQALADFLRGEGAQVYLVLLPQCEGVNGPDDFIALRGDQAMLELLDTAQEYHVGNEEQLTSSHDGNANDAERESAATKLIHLAERMELFHDAMGDAYATVLVNGYRETIRIDSRAFRRRLSFEFYAAEGKAPSPQAASSALPTVEAKALFEGNQREVHVRVAEHDGEIYIDLCSPEWEVVRIAKDGWDVVRDLPVRFVRREGMLPLPMPVHGGSLDVLRGLVNVEDADWPLVAGYLLGCLREVGPFPVLALIGEQGAGKSTVSRLLKTVIDPSEAPVRCAPKDERDLLIAAQGAHVLALDNLSHLDEQLSDALCRLATGSGLATRTLYTDRDETIFRAARPVVINSIGDVLTRSDLLDRAIVLSVPPLDAAKRRPETEYWADLRKVHPAILGCLCDAASMALRETKRPDPAPDVRMLDFALFVMRGETALGLEHGLFAKAYESNRKAANESVVDLSLVAQAVIRLAEGRGEWKGSFAELLALLTPTVSAETARSREWPKTARGLSGAVRRMVPNLRRVGIEVAFPGRASHCGRSMVSVTKVSDKHSPPSPSPDLHPTFTPEPADNARDKGRANVVNVSTAKVKIEEGDV